MIVREIMSTKASLRTISLSGGLCLIAFAGVAFAVASGCSKSEAATSRGTTSESAAVAASPKADTENFAVEIKASKSPYAAGSEGKVDLVLATKGGYHMNDQYPYKFKVADPPAEGVSYPKAIVAKSDFSFTEENKNNPANKDHKADTAKVQIPFVAAKAGKATVAGTLYLSVCSDANCVMDKVPLELAVDVK